MPKYRSSLCHYYKSTAASIFQNKIFNLPEVGLGISTRDFKNYKEGNTKTKQRYLLQEKKITN